MILCDIGNTTFHFQINGISKKYFINEELPKLEEKIFYISVNENATKKLLDNYTNCINLKDKFSFKTTYEGMGIDRKVACFGETNSIVVDAGSAITVDVIKSSIHLGGFILPGIMSFKKSYADISPVLDHEINTKVNLDKIPLCTKDAISYSILKSIILPIKEIAKNENIIFTGGDGEFLSSYFENCIYKEDLIFEKMKGIINANNCIA